MNLCLIWVQLNGGGDGGVSYSRGTALGRTIKILILSFALPIEGFFKVVALSSNWPEGETPTGGIEEHSSF